MWLSEEGTGVILQLWVVAFSQTLLFLILKTSMDRKVSFWKGLWRECQVDWLLGSV